MPGAEPPAVAPPRGGGHGLDGPEARHAPTPGDDAPSPTRLRVRYSKTGKIRFTSHRDVVRMWERALRRSGLPVARSEGFSPHPLLSFGLALPTGAESLGEYLDVVLDDGGGAGGWPWADLRAVLTALLPEGIAVQACAPVAHRSASLQQEVSSCSWRLEVYGLAAEELASRVERLLAATSVLVERERRGRSASDDLRPAVLSLAVASSSPPDAAEAHASSAAWLDAELATRPRGVRPRELLEGLGPDVRLSRACRVHQWIERDGTRLEPLELPGTAMGAATTHAQVRAS